MHREDLLGKHFGRLIVEGFSHKNSQGKLYWLCKCACGEVAMIRADHLQRGLTKSCGCLTREASIRCGVNSLAWKGGRRITKDGYVEIYMPGHPRVKANKCVSEHRLVMEHILGRFLFPQEFVHHKDGNRQNNKPENLELWSTSQPPGQRVAEKVEWAWFILSQYAPSLLFG